MAVEQIEQNFAQVIEAPVLEKKQKKYSGGSGKKNKIFISWSGEYTRQIATEIKKALEDKVFKDYELDCFVSAEDIESGEDWRKRVHKELHSSKMGIICITKENIRAPWIYLEAGAMFDRNVHTIPLLLNCDTSILADTPLNVKQSVRFHQEDEFKKMLISINKKMGFGMPIEEIEACYRTVHAELKRSMSKIFSKLKDLRVFNEHYVYPSDVTSFNYHTVFLSSPMSSVDSETYEDLREIAMGIRESLLDIGFKDVICPLIEKKKQGEFDGKVKAIKENYPMLKQVDSMVVVYPWKNASSALVEMGYGIALSKKMVVFYRDGLPYIMEGAHGTIPHVKTYHFKDFDDIRHMIESNGMALFE